MNKVYGYMRVSTISQNESRQEVELKEFGVNKIFFDKISGKNFERPAYQKLLKIIKHGDCIVVKSLDRLGRNYKEIIKEWKDIVNERGVDIIILDMPLLNTKTNKDLLGTLISDLVLGLLSYVAENEYMQIHERQKEGIIQAKKRGVKFGRPKLEFTPLFEDYFIKYKKKEISKSYFREILNLTKKELNLQLDRKRKQNIKNKEGL